MLHWSKACEGERLGAQRKQEAALSGELLRARKPHTKELGQSYVPHATVPVTIQFASSGCLVTGFYHGTLPVIPVFGLLVSKTP